MSQLSAGTEGAIDANIELDLDMSYMDFIVNFGLPIPMIDIDFGVNLRRTAFSIAASSDFVGATDIGNYEANLLFPLPYAAVAFEIPTSGVELGAEISTLPFDSFGVNITDYELKAKYFVPLPSDLLMRVGLEVSYHSYTFDLNGENVTFSDELKPYKANMGYKGLGVGLVAQF